MRSGIKSTNNKLVKVTVQEENRKKQLKLMKRSQVVQHDTFQKSEGVLYQPQDFHTKSRNYKIVYNEYTFFHLQFYIL